MKFNLKEQQWQIRKYRDEDLDYIIHIEDTISNERRGIYPMNFKNLIRSKAMHSFFVLQAGDNVVGYIVFSLVGKKLHRLGVWKPLQRCGIGTELIRYSKKFSDELSIWVDEYNVPAQLFLRQNGFLWVETCDGEYRMKWKEQYPESH